MFVLAFSFAFSIHAASIEGIVYDQNNVPLREIDMELRNENGVTRGRTKTDGTGRYRFSGLADGRYYVKAFAFRYNLIDDEKMVKIDTLSILGGIGADVIQQDFYLKFKKGGLSDTTTGVVFAQEVPNEAERHFEAAVKSIRDDKRGEGIASLIKAVDAFPTYYNALSVLGVQLILTERYMDAASVFVRAVEVNPKSSRAFYYMGVAFSNLGEKFYKAALVAQGKAKVLAPSAHQIPLEIGKLHRKMKNFTEAEANLLQAKKLSEKRNPEIHKELAQLYANDLKQYGKAADELELYLKATKQKDENTKQQIANLRAKAKNQN